MTTKEIVIEMKKVVKPRVYIQGGIAYIPFHYIPKGDGLWLAIYA